MRMRTRKYATYTIVDLYQKNALSLVIIICCVPRCYLIDESYGVQLSVFCTQLRKRTWSTYCQFFCCLLPVAQFYHKVSWLIILLWLIIVRTDIELVLSPDSRLLPVGSNATFTCKFRNVQQHHHPFWKVNQTQASNSYNRDRLIKKGFIILDDQEDNGITTLTLRVNGSHDGVNNTKIQCRTLTDVHSELATILTIAGKN